MTVQLGFRLNGEVLVRLHFAGTARRLVGLTVLLFFVIPVGLSVTGCGNHSTPVQYCSAGDSGPVVGQVAHITLAPNFATVGESLNYGQIGASLSATATDCKGNAVSVRSYTYASTSSYNVNSTGGSVFADINPSTGQVCGGTWNRNTGGGIPNYTTCTAPNPPPTAFLAYVTATANGAVSNPIPVYVHPVVTGIVLGTPTPTGSCPTATSPGVNPGTDCALCSPSTVGTPIVAPPYDANKCLSQKGVAQLVARVYSNGDTLPEHNITCRVGHVTLAPQTASIVTIDATGVATANQPGSTVITATVSNSSTASQAGFFSTCPPAEIDLSIPGQPAGTSTIDIGLNNTQQLTTTVYDTNHVALTGLALEFLSTTPQTIGAGAGSVTPVFPGAANITAVCLPANCNPAPFSQIGLFGNGKPITSNPITVTAQGTSSTVIYMASTESQYVQPFDFTTNQPSTSIKLPYVPNSMVINQTGTGVYLGSTQGLMSFSTTNNLLGNVNQGVPGIVLAVSPDGGTLVVTDPVRQTISLVTSGGGVTSTYGGVGTHAQWSPDSQVVYVTTTTGAILVHSVYTDWQTATDTAENYTDVAVTAPHIGAFFAGKNSTDGRSYCSISTEEPGTTVPPRENNQFIPLADQSAAKTDRIAATTDGKHIIGAHLNTDGTSTLSDIVVSYPETATQPDGPGSCTTATAPVVFTSTYTTYPLPGILAAVDAASLPLTQPTAITGVVPSSNSAAAFVTYTGTSGKIPFYTTSTTGNGAVQILTLGNGATAASSPVSGVFSTDNFSFYTGTYAADGTSVDNDVHIFTLAYPAGAAPTAKETGVITPNLPLATGTGNAPVNLLVQHPKKATS